MKIVQRINLYRESNQVTTYPESYSRHYFDPAKFSGIQAIYFEGVPYGNGDGVTFTCRLYDKTHSSVIAEFSGTGRHNNVYRSADIKASLTSACELEIQAKRIAGETSDNGGIIFPTLIVLQDTTGDNKKTAIHYSVDNHGYENYSAGWNTDNNNLITPRISACDGTVQFFLEVWMKNSAATYTRAKLYDLTLGEDVANSEISTNSATWTKCRSAALTLTQGHQYAVMRGADGGSQTSSWGTELLICEVSNFIKTAAIIFGNNNAETITQNEGEPVLPESYFRVGDLSAVAISYQWDIAGYSEYPQDDTVLLNLVHEPSTVIPGGTVNIFLLEEYGDWTESLTLTPTETENFLCQILDPNGAWMDSHQHTIFALLDDTVAPTFSLPPDPKMPNGYTCFIKQFVKNSLSGNVPPITPDGVNRAW